MDVEEGYGWFMCEVVVLGFGVVGVGGYDV